MTIDIRNLESPPEMDELLRLASRVWGMAPGGFVGPDFLLALAHAGGYVSGAFRAGEMIGASFGMLARHRDDWCLHSHITCVRADHQSTGLGRAIKRHQRAWAAEHHLTAITWTFDPLVRRNAWFNLHVLGAIGVEYHENFYGPLGDEINGDDDSDRLLARWEVGSERARRADASPLATATPGPNDKVVEIPDDIVALRRSSPDEAFEWRRRLRGTLAPLLSTHDVVGLTPDGHYVVSPGAEPSFA